MRGAPTSLLTRLLNNSGLDHAVVFVERPHAGIGQQRSLRLKICDICPLVGFDNHETIIERRNIAYLQTSDKSSEHKAKEHADKKAMWDAMTEEEKAAYKAEKQAKWDALSAEEKSADMWERVCYTENSAACIVGTKMKKYGAEAGLAKFDKLKAAEEGKFVFAEKEFNSLGYAFLYVDKTDEAITILSLNLREYPDSWNTYDSLAEAHTQAKNYEKAIELYEVAVKMNPESEHTVAQLNKLRTMVAGQ